MLGVFISCYQYLIDSFEVFAASALVGTTVARYCVAGRCTALGLIFHITDCARSDGNRLRTDVQESGRALGLDARWVPKFTDDPGPIYLLQVWRSD